MVERQQQVGQEGKRRLRVNPLSAYTTLLSALGLVLFICSLSQLSASGPGLLLFVVLVTISQLTTSTALTPEIAFSVGSVVTFATLLLFDPLAAALVGSVGGFLSSLMTHISAVRRGQPSRVPLWQRILFNMAAFSLAVFVAAWVYRLSGGAAGQVALLSNVMPMILAALACEFANALFVVVAVALQTGRSPIGIWLENVSWAIPINILAMVIGGSGLALGFEIAGYLGVIVFSLPIFLTIYSFRLYVSRTKAHMERQETTIARLEQAQSEIRRQAAHLEALNAIMTAVTAAPDLSRLLDIALSHTRQALGLEMGMVWIADQAVAHGMPAEVVSAIDDWGKESGEKASRAVVIEDWQKGPSVAAPPAWGQRLAQAGIRAAIAAPILLAEECIGGLCLASAWPRAWASDERVLLEAVAGQLATAAERMKLLQEVQRHTEELEAAVAQLQELDRLKSEFMQNASHELRTPLTLIRGYVELLTEGEFGDFAEEQRDALGVIVRQTQLLENLVENITLSLAAKTHSLSREPLAMDDLLLATMHDYYVEAERAGLTLVTEIEPHLPLVSGEPYYLQCVLHNLVSNAIKFTPAGGTITLGCRQQEGRVQVYVSDTGIGIPAAEQARIFDRFYQVDSGPKRKYGGMGLGLALLKEIVEAHEGTVTVESEVGVGSTFTVSLPALAGSRARRHRPGARQRLSSGRELSVQEMASGTVSPQV